MLLRRHFLTGSAALAALPFAPRLLLAQAAPQPLAMPPLLDATQTQKFALNAQAGARNFLGQAESLTWGFNQPFLGPVLRLNARGETVAEVSNALGEAISVHWHGLVAPGAVDGGPHQPVQPGQTWSPTLPVDQAAATIWYHSHTHGATGRQVNSGLAGVMQLSDGQDDARGLPSAYGVDDLTLVLQDRRLDSEGRMDYALSMHDRMMGFMGNVMLVNGQVGATAMVPQGIVRLRLLNGSNARVYGLRLSDNRPLHLIGTDSGLLDQPIALTFLTLAPGERAEVLVDFGDGRTASLLSEQALNADLSGGDPSVAPFEVLPFAVDPALPARITSLPESLGGERPALEVAKATPRQIALEMGMGPMAMMSPSGSAHAINGRAFDMMRTDFQIGLGTLERWAVSGNMIAHPFHVHGVKFQVLSENGAPPRAQNTGWKDTILVNGQAEIAMQFTQPASAELPFMFHCHILEHEDGGMMGQFAVS